MAYFQDKIFEYFLDFNLLFYYCYYHGCIPSDSLWVLVIPSKCGFNYLGVQVDWKHILVASVSMDVLHIFGVAPFWEHFWLTAPFQCFSNSYFIIKVISYIFEKLKKKDCYVINDSKSAKRILMKGKNF